MFILKNSIEWQQLMNDIKIMKEEINTLTSDKVVIQRCIVLINTQLHAIQKEIKEQKETLLNYDISVET